MKCFACDRKVHNPAIADTRDDQWVYVGSECFRYIERAGESGYQPPKGGPRLYLMNADRARAYLERGMDPTGRLWAWHQTVV